MKSSFLSLLAMRLVILFPRDCTCVCERIARLRCLFVKSRCPCDLSCSCEKMKSFRRCWRRRTIDFIFCQLQTWASASQCSLALSPFGTLDAFFESIVPGPNLLRARTCCFVLGLYRRTSAQRLTNIENLTSSRHRASHIRGARPWSYRTLLRYLVAFALGSHSPTYCSGVPSCVLFLSFCGMSTRSISGSLPSCRKLEHFVLFSLVKLFGSPSSSRKQSGIVLINVSVGATF